MWVFTSVCVCVCVCRATGGKPVCRTIAVEEAVSTKYKVKEKCLLCLLSVIRHWYEHTELALISVRFCNDGHYFLLIIIAVQNWVSRVFVSGMLYILTVLPLFCPFSPLCSHILLPTMTPRSKTPIPSNALLTKGLPDSTVSAQFQTNQNKYTHQHTCQLCVWRDVS